jgi:hypothetical protein
LDYENTFSSELAITDDQLLAMCEAELQAAKSNVGKVRDIQKKAREQYFMENTQNVLYSSVQSSDVRDMVEAAMPILMDMFTASEAPVVFRPINQQDVPQADNETMYCQNVLFTQNDGLLTIYNWWKDALLFKNGYIKAFWDSKVEEEKETYNALTQEEYMALLNDQNFKPMQIVEVPGKGIMGYFTKTYSVWGHRVRDAGQARVFNIQPNRVFVSATHTKVDLSKASYVSHLEYRTKSDLVVDGYDPEKVIDLPATQMWDDYGDDLNMRQTSQAAWFGNSGKTDRSRELVEYFEHYIRADRDGDGVAELLQVCSVGDVSGTLLSVKEVDSIPIFACTAYPVPHSHYGMSIAEFAGETQDIKTALLRQMMDNLYLANKPLMEADIASIVNPSVLANPKPGTIVQSRGGNALRPIAVPFVAAQVLPVIERLDMILEKRTGLTDLNSGMDATTLSGATNMVGAMTLNQAQLRMKSMVTMLCETGLRPLMYRLRELMMKYMDREDMFALAGEWVPVNPRSWREKRDTELRIGIGTVQKQERMSVLNQVAALQEKIVAAQQGTDGPFVTPDNIFNTLQDIERVAGHRSKERYFTNPQKYTPPPPAPDVASEAMQIEKAKLEVSAQEKAANVEIRAFEAGLKAVELAAKMNQQTQAVSQEAQGAVANVR